jgi:two-component system cell cycle sensor histidine kinase/response regulator CckA
MLRRLIGEKIQLVVSHDRDLGAVRADPTQLEQVIVNLAVNARCHSGSCSQGGRRRQRGVDLATRRVPAADVRAMRSEILPVADYTALVVRDTGGGIPADIWARSGSRSSPPRSRARDGPGSFNGLWHREAIGRVHFRRQAAQDGVRRTHGLRSICRCIMARVETVARPRLRK